MSTIPQNLLTTNGFLSDLFGRRGIKIAGNHTTRFVELNGGSVIEPTSFEPDPNTHRSEYYYNAITNTLFRKITRASSNGQYNSHWKKVSE